MCLQVYKNGRPLQFDSVDYDDDDEAINRFVPLTHMY